MNHRMTESVRKILTPFLNKLNPIPDLKTSGEDRTQFYIE